MDRRVKERLVGASILVVLIVLIVPELLSGPPSPAPAALGPRLPVTTPAEAVRNVTVDLATSKAQEPDPSPTEPAPSSAPLPQAAGADAVSAAVGADAGNDTGTPPANAPAADSLPADAPRADASHANAPRAAAPPGPAQSAPLETAAPAPISNSVTKPAIPAKPAIAAKPAVGGRAWAVQLGSFASRANADKLVRQAKAQGYAAYIAPGGSGPSLRYRVRIGPMADRGAAVQTLAKLKSTGQSASLVAPSP
jgi:DedD protein